MSFIFSLNLFGKTNNIQNQGWGGCCKETGGSGGKTDGGGGGGTVSLGSDVSGWATELGLGSISAQTTSGGNTVDTFTSGSITLNPNTGRIVTLSENSASAPGAVAELALELGMGALKSASGNVYTFATGSITTDGSGNITSDTGGTDHDTEAKAVGTQLGFGNFKQVTTTTDNPPQKKYDFDNGSIWTNASTGALNGCSIGGKGFNGEVMSAAYLRGLGAFVSESQSGNSLTFQFRLGTVHVTSANADGSGTWTVDKVTTNS